MAVARRPDRIVLCRTTVRLGVRRFRSQRYRSWMTVPGRTIRHLPVEAAPAAIRRGLERHEGRVAGATGRRFTDLGDAVLVHDVQASGSWRTWLGDVCWPSAGAAFERRLLD